ncbi:MAG: signal peptidase I [Planctomycetota bacterium]
MRRTPWRDNLEALVVAVILALLLKGFIVDAYRIPTGSMQPTLFGDERLGLFDRILVDRLSPLIVEPERFDVVVFRYPLDRSQNFVKRIVGVGPEELEIRGGDLFQRRDASQPWAIVRKPRTVQSSLLRELLPLDPDAALFGGNADWSFEGRSVRAASAGRARFVGVEGSVRNSPLDGYPPRIAAALRERVHDFGHELVADVAVRGDVTPGADATSVWVELFEGRRRYRFELAGPAAGDGVATASIWLASEHGEPQLLASTMQALPLAKGARTRFVAQNLDDRLELLVDGEPILAADVEPASDRRSEVWIGLESGSAAFDDLAVHRDIHYTAQRAVTDRIEIPPGHYYMLGDNPSNSSDSREWRFTRFDTDAGILRGNTSHGKNPRTVGLGDPYGPSLVFGDEWGETHWLRPSDARRLPPEEAPFVPRSAIVGRAWAVFWPWSRTYGSRLRWIR